jgi:hypothetical protein
MNFDLRLVQCGGADWNVTASEAAHYHLFCPSARQGIPPDRFVSYKEGRFDSYAFASSVDILLRFTAGEDDVMNLRTVGCILFRVIRPSKTCKSMRLGAFPDPNNLAEISARRTTGRESVSTNDSLGEPC